MSNFAEKEFNRLVNREISAFNYVIPFGLTEEEKTELASFVEYMKGVEKKERKEIIKHRVLIAIALIAIGFFTVTAKAPFLFTSILMVIVTILGCLTEPFYVMKKVDKK